MCLTSEHCTSRYLPEYIVYIQWLKTLLCVTATEIATSLGYQQSLTPLDLEFRQEAAGELQENFKLLKIGILSYL